jgi:hypothetical protein
LTEAENAAACFEFVNTAIAADFDLEHQLGGDNLPAVGIRAHVESVFVNEGAHFGVDGSDPLGVLRRGQGLPYGFRVAQKGNSVNGVSIRRHTRVSFETFDERW